MTSPSLSLTLAWALLSTVGAFDCLTCTNDDCSSTASVTCFSERMCITASGRATLSGVTTTEFFKGCATASLCPTAGFHTYAVDLGHSSAAALGLCCNEDNCNSATIAVPLEEDKNGLKCYTCDSRSSHCRTTLECQGAENRCFQANVTNGSETALAFGCASRNLCASAARLGSLPFMDNVGTFRSGPNCCGTSFCSSAPTDTPTMEPVVQPTSTCNNTSTDSAACGVELSMIHLLLGLLICTLK